MIESPRITNIEITPFGIPIRAFADAYTSFERSKAVLVRIHASDGSVGIGEACAWEPEFYGETLESVSTSIARYIAPKIVGMKALEIAPVMRTVDEALARVTCAKEGVDLALHDLAGKILHVPVYTLLGGKYREKIPVASEIGIDAPEVMAENALRVCGMGIRVIKIKGSADPRTDVRRVRAVRDAVGEDVALRLDPNAHWTAHDTVQVLREIASCRLEFLEQPVGGADLDGMKRIRALGLVSLMADESVWSPEDVLTLSRLEAADIVNIKLAKTSGLLGAKRVETVATAVGMTCVIGTEIEPGFSLAAKIHLAASIRHLPLACEFTELTLLKENLLKPAPVLVDGSLAVPEGEGFGFDLDEAVLARNCLEI